MAQVSRALKKGLLLLCPASLRLSLLQSRPNLRKAAPGGMKLRFHHYLGNLSVDIDTTYKVERIMWTGEYEPPLMRFLRTHQTAGWTCFDVGANVGAVALALAKYSGAQGSVYAFEPGPPNLLRLGNNFALNPELQARTQILPVGVGETPGELWWAEEQGNPGNALLSGAGTHRIRVVTLDDVAREHRIDRVDFIKIDVEGMELQVMRGAEGLLRNSRPALYFETLSRYVETDKGAAFGNFQKLLVDELGYLLHRLGPAGELIPLSGSGHGDYTVAVHPQNPVLPRA
jgi:FkbM family methyltransferase